MIRNFKFTYGLQGVWRDLICLCGVSFLIAIEPYYYYRWQIPVMFVFYFLISFHLFFYFILIFKIFFLGLVGLFRSNLKMKTSTAYTGKFFKEGNSQLNTMWRLKSRPVSKKIIPLILTQGSIIAHIQNAKMESTFRKDVKVRIGWCMSHVHCCWLVFTVIFELALFFLPPSGCQK